VNSALSVVGGRSSSGAAEWGMQVRVHCTEVCLQWVVQAIGWVGQDQGVQFGG
jgi:hypothetical protein